LVNSAGRRLIWVPQPMIRSSGGALSNKSGMRDRAVRSCGAGSEGEGGRGAGGMGRFLSLAVAVRDDGGVGRAAAGVNRMMERLRTVLAAGAAAQGRGTIVRCACFTAE
jgi:hypothetical protein